MCSSAEKQGGCKDEKEKSKSRRHKSDFNMVGCQFTANNKQSNASGTKLPSACGTWPV
jgi:hypothetical protein